MRWYWWTIIIVVCGFMVFGCGWFLHAAWDCRKIETTEPEMTEFNSKQSHD